MFSSLSMSLETHSLELQGPFQSPPAVYDDEKGPRQRKLSLSLIYEDGNEEVQDRHAFESNPLSYNDVEEDEDRDFQKLSFTRTRKMSDAGGW